MSTDMTWQTVSINSEDTEKLGEHIGAKLLGGEIIELVSDLGGGKTTFVRGLARGAGSIDRVASPSFTISRVYTAGKLQLHHFDLYRLQDIGLQAHEITDIVSDKEAVLIVEWADIAQSVLPKTRVKIEIVPTSENSRQTTFHYPDSLKYLLEGLC